MEIAVRSDSHEDSDGIENEYGNSSSSHEEYEYREEVSEGETVEVATRPDSHEETQDGDDGVYEAWEVQGIGATEDLGDKEDMPTAGTDPMFEAATQLFRQQENWADLLRVAKDLRQQLAADACTDSSPRFQGIEDLDHRISELRTSYQEIQRHRQSNRAIPKDLLQTCETRVEDISHKVFRILSKVQARAGARTEAGQRMQHQAYAANLLGQCETRVIAHLIETVTACLMAHYIDGELAVEGFEAVFCLLEVVLSVCDRIFALKRQGIVPGRDQHRALRPSLRNLRRGWERAAFESRLKTAADQQRITGPWPTRTSRDTGDHIEVEETEAVSSARTEEWTEDETLALLDGLRMYQGESFVARFAFPQHFQS
jgi:hypothetical protein